MAQQSARRDRENQSATPYLEYAGLIWTRSANSHAGRRLMAASRGRTDGSIRLRVITILKFPLAQKGASTDVAGRHSGRKRPFCHAADQVTWTEFGRPRSS